MTWISRRVEDDDAISPTKFIPKLSTIGGHEEKQNFRTGIEFVHHLLCSGRFSHPTGNRTCFQLNVHLPDLNFKKKSVFLHQSGGSGFLLCVNFRPLIVQFEIVVISSFLERIVQHFGMVQYSFQKLTSSKEQVKFRRTLQFAIHGLLEDVWRLFN